MITSNIEAGKLLILGLIFSIVLGACASQGPFPPPSKQLTQEQVKQCRDGSSPLCVTKMGKPTQCSCNAKEDLRRIIENPGDDAIFTPTDVRDD